MRVSEVWYKTFKYYLLNSTIWSPPMVISSSIKRTIINKIRINNSQFYELARSTIHG